MFKERATKEMANADVTAKSFFQIPPTPENPDRVVLCNQGFRLSDIHLITEVAMLSKLQYIFHVYIGYSAEFKLAFEFERKGDALSCHRELCRAWASTGEYEHIRRNNHVW